MSAVLKPVLYLAAAVDVSDRVRVRPSIRLIKQLRERKKGERAARWPLDGKAPELIFNRASLPRWDYSRLIKRQDKRPKCLQR